MHLNHFEIETCGRNTVEGFKVIMYATKHFVSTQWRLGKGNGTPRLAGRVVFRFLASVTEDT